MVCLYCNAIRRLVGTFRTCGNARRCSAIGSKADPRLGTLQRKFSAKYQIAWSCRFRRCLRGRVEPATSWCQRPRLPMLVAQLRFEEAHCVVAELDQQGHFRFTKTNAYSGNNGRAAIKLSIPQKQRALRKCCATFPSRQGPQV